MIRPIDAMLDRLAQFNLRPSGRNRWRACCPAHGGKNRSALSIGISNDDAVLLRCWSGCEVDQVAGALGLELIDLFPPRPQPGGGGSKPKRIGMLTAGQALALIRSDAQLIWMAGQNLANGYTLNDADLLHLNAAAGRIENLTLEVQE